MGQSIRRYVSGGMFFWETKRASSAIEAVNSLKKPGYLIEMKVSGSSILGPDGRPAIPPKDAKIFIKKNEIIQPLPREDPMLFQAKVDLKRAITAIGNIRRIDDARSLILKNELTGHIDKIITLNKLLDNDAKEALKNGSLFTILAISDSREIHKKAYQVLEFLRPDYDYSQKELNLLLDSIAAYKTEDAPFAGRVINMVTEKLSSLSEEDYLKYLAVLRRLPRQYYKNGIPNLPADMTFGIEVETSLWNGERLMNNETSALLKGLKLFMDKEGLRRKGWVCKRDGQNIEFTTKDGGLRNDKDGFDELREGFFKILEFLNKEKPSGLELKQSLHIHIGNLKPGDKSVRLALGYIGKAMEYYWSRLSVTGDIIVFSDRALIGQDRGGKNVTPFYIDNQRKTIAFNTFFIPAMTLYENPVYFAKLQAVIGIAMGIAYNAAVRSDEFNLFSAGLPVYQRSVYTLRNAYLLRKHLGLLMKGNPEGSIMLSQALLDSGNFTPVAAPEEYDSLSKKEIADFFKRNNMGLLYQLYLDKGNEGWNIKEALEKMVNDKTKKDELLRICRVIWNITGSQADIDWIVSLLNKMKDASGISEAEFITILRSIYKEIHTLAGHSGLVKGVAFSPDGVLLASCSDDGSIGLYMQLYDILKANGFKSSVDKINQVSASSAVEKADIEGLTSSPATSNDKGGIAFNSLPIQTESVASSALGVLPEGRAFKGDLDAEWGRIQDVFNAGIRPSIQRISEYTAAASASPLAEDKIDQVRVMLADILRRDEESQKPTPAEESCKQLLRALEAG